MQEYDLSVVIPSRKEMFLAGTVENILKNKRANTEIIVVLDGAWADPPICQHPDVNIIHVPKAIGQRAATNLGIRLSKAKYVMKVDAHCSFDKGFDKKMLDGFKKIGNDKATMVPIMRNLWMFDWKCHHCGWKKYQGPTPKKCENCGKTDKIKRKMMWIGKERPQSKSYCFDKDPHFQYFNEYTKRDEFKEDAKTGFTKTMSLQGSCYMMTRDRYLELAPSREKFGSWGNEGMEIACFSWLSGGEVLVNHNTWYAHMFRTQGGDFSFPYKQSGREVKRTKNRVWEAIKEKKLPGQKNAVSWLIKKFAPVKGWSDSDIKKLEEQEKLIKP